MIAYRFLSAGAVGPFTGARIALGQWIEQPPGPLVASDARGCRACHLAYWLDDELFRVELDGNVRETGTEVVAARARVLDRVTEWGAGAAAELTLFCALRVRDLMAEALAARKMTEDAARLRAIDDLDALVEEARRLESRDRDVAGYVSDAAYYAALGMTGTIAYVAAVAAEATGAGFASERARQGAWLARRLSLLDSERFDVAV